ncbi:MAG: hypothetical protein ACREBC_36200 [Pyrinomonadaceae bacterium]
MLQKFKELSADELLQELRAHGAKAGKAARAVPLEPRENLHEFDDATIIKVLKEKQKVIYGSHVLNGKFKHCFSGSESVVMNLWSVKHASSRS